MGALTVSDGQIRGGVWRGLLVASERQTEQPRIDVLHLGKPLEGVQVIPDPEVDKLWTLAAPIPAELLSDGVLTFLVQDRSSGETLSRFSIAAGAPLEEDIRAELDLLSAELELLKQAFRRHCVETSRDQKPN